MEVSHNRVLALPFQFFIDGLSYGVTL